MVNMSLFESLEYETEHLALRSTQNGYHGQIRCLSAGRGGNVETEKGYVTV